MTRVLVINDSQFERLIMKDMVSRLGYEAKTSDEYSTMNLIESYNPNIVIANMTMNKTSGDKLIAAIKVKKPDIKCYLSSCSKIRTDKLQYQGVDGCIETPITPGQLNRILRNEVQGTSQVDQELQENSHSLSFANASALTPGDQEEINTQSGKMQVHVGGDDLGNQSEQASFAFCPYCGQKIVKTNIKYVFCPFCGNKF